MNGVTLNKKIPFNFNIVRVIGLISICLIVYSIKTKKFWKEKYSIKNLPQNIALIAIIDIGILFIFFINQCCGNFEETDLYNENLVKALSKGKVAISDTPDNSKLEELENPYDSIERGKIERDKDYIWDAAYYNKQYYVYFGVLPAILIMVPYYLITKKLMYSATVTLIFSLVSVPVLDFLVRKIFEKYFKELPFKYMALSSVMMIVGTSLIWINVAPRFYELVTVAGFFFAILGFLLIFDCEKEDKILYRKIFFGSLSLALSVACRPTYIFISFLVVPILLRIFIKNLKDRKNIVKNILVVAIPYIVIAGFIMRYNYLRFGSPFEFGEKYQLTVNNMKELSVRLINLPTGIFCNLFGLPTFQAVFPFLHSNGNIIDTFSYFYVEDMPGGVFFLAPIAFFCFGIVWLWKNSQNKTLKEFITSLLVIALLMVSFISIKAGSTGRYLLDFAWLFVLTRNNNTVIINVLSGFCVIGGKNSMKNNCPKMYYNLEYTVMFLK